MKKDVSYYTNQFTKLRVDRVHGAAPHKPILLLSIIELIEQGKIQHNRIFLTPELISSFLKYWGKFGSENHRSDIAQPFFHLTSDKFWHLAPNSGFESTIEARIKLKSLTALRNAVNYGYFDQELFELLQQSESRIELVTTLIQHWFPGRLGEVEELSQVDIFQEIQLRLFEQGGATYNAEEVKDEEQTFVRSGAFRRIVVSLYDHRCALCKLKIISLENQNIVDGAHIKPFAEFRDDYFDNGLALCKNHHWAFDRGWVSISSNYRILIAHHLFTEEPPEASRSMRDFHDELIYLPDEQKYHPRVEALQWHRDFWSIA